MPSLKLNMDTSRLLNRPLFNISDTEITLLSIIVFIAILAFTIIASILIQKALTRALDKRFAQNNGTLIALLRLLHYFLMIIGLGVSLEMVGIKISTLFAAGAVFALAIGFAMQNIIQNFVSGVLLLVERSIKPGDILEIEGSIVKVIDMGIRTTVVRSLREEDLIIPNSIFAQSTVKNFTLRDSHFRIEANVGVSYDSDIKKVMEVLTQTVEDVPWRLPSLAPRVVLKDFGSSSVDFTISIGIDDPWNQRLLLSNLRQAIWFAFKKSDIVIAYPQLDLHIDENLTEVLSKNVKKVSGANPNEVEAKA